MDLISTCGSASNKIRGGNRKLAKFAVKQAKIIEFGQSLKVIESHYNRHRATLRKYIAPELNIAKFCKMYNGSVGCELKVKEAYFREVVNKNFNFYFGSPKTDVCSTCLYLEEQLKQEKDVNKLNILETQKQEHKLRADTFYTRLKSENDEALFITFDCQRAYCCQEYLIKLLTSVGSIPVKTLA